jgi:hypothetical protein
MILRWPGGRNETGPAVMRGRCGAHKTALQTAALFVGEARIVGGEAGRSGRPAFPGGWGTSRCRGGVEGGSARTPRIRWERVGESRRGRDRTWGQKKSLRKDAGTSPCGLIQLKKEISNKHLIGKKLTDLSTLPWKYHTVHPFQNRYVACNLQFPFHYIGTVYCCRLTGVTLLYIKRNTSRYRYCWFCKLSYHFYIFCSGIWIRLPNYVKRICT